MMDFTGRTAILAAGDFPSSPIARGALETARRVVCCDGAAAGFIRRMKRIPDAVVGDLDSIPKSVLRRCGDAAVRVPEQDDNDLAKAFRLCIGRGWRDIVILGATGGREDHTIGNVGWIAEFVREAPGVAIVTDYGVFTAVSDSGGSVETKAGMQVSFFSPGQDTWLSATGVKFPVADLHLRRWFSATLNEATGGRIALKVSGGPAIVFRTYGCNSAARRQ